MTPDCWTLVTTPPIATQKLASWAELGDNEAARFADAARYSITVNLSNAEADGWFLDLGDLRVGARVRGNSFPSGLRIPFRKKWWSLGECTAGSVGRWSHLFDIVG